MKRKMPVIYLFIIGRTSQKITPATRLRYLDIWHGRPRITSTSPMSDVMEYRASKRSRSRSPDHRSRQRTRNSGRYEDSRRRKRRPEISKYSSSSHIEKTNRNYALSVFVGNLPFDCSWTDLKNHFESIGEVVRADIVTSQGKLRGMG